jgi:CHAT domain-containing protein
MNYFVYKYLIYFAPINSKYHIFAILIDMFQDFIFYPIIQVVFMKRTVLLIIISAFIAFNCQLSAQQTDSTLKWKELQDSTSFYYDKSDFETALKWGEKSLAQAEKEFGKMDTNYANTLSYIPMCLFYLSNIDSAIYYGENYLNICRTIYKSDHPELAIILNNLAEFCRKNGEYSRAELMYKESLEMNRRLFKNDNIVLAKGIMNLAVFYHISSDYKQAEPLYMEALEMHRHLFKQDTIDLGYCINNVASFYKDKNDFDLAEPLYMEALEMFRHIFKDGHPLLATTIGNVATFYNTIGKYILAESLFKESLEMKRRIFKDKDHTDLALGITNMATYYSGIDELQLAEPLVKEALEMNRRLYKDKDHKDLASSIDNMAFFYKRKGYLIESGTLKKESLEMYRRIFKGKDHEDLAGSIERMAIYYQEIGDSILAESLYKESLEMFKRIFNGDNIYKARCMSELAYFYACKHNFKLSETLSKEALEMIKRLLTGDHADIAESITNMAFAYNNLEDNQKAEPLYMEALDMSRRLYKGFHKGLALSIWNLAAFYGKQSRYKEALPLYCESIQVRENIIKNYFPSLPEIEKEKFLTTVNKTYDRFHSVPCYLSYTNDKELDSVYKRSLKQEYDNLLFSKGILLNSTSKVRNQIMNSGDSSLIDLFNNLRDKRIYISKIYNMTNQELTERNINFDSVMNAANDIEKELTKKSDAFAKENDKKIIKWKDVQNSLGKDEAAIELVRFNFYDSKQRRTTDSVFYAALILKHSSDDLKSSDESNKSPELVLLENGNDLEEKYFAKYSKMIKDLGEEYRDSTKLWTDLYIKNSLKDMYVNFWQKIQEKLVGVKTVYLSVDGVYNKINLNTLINPETNKYLTEELDLRIVTSTRDLVNRNLIASNNQSGNNTAELFGSPKFNLDSNEINDISQKYAEYKQNFENSSSNKKIFRGLGDTLLRGLGYDELPGTKIKIEKIAEILKSKGWTANTHTGKDATEEAVKSVNSPKILHIATHGQFDRDNETSEEQKKLYENPLLKSKLILAGGENTRLKLGNNESVDSGTEDGYLTAYEVMNMNLDNTELVVLSACETGLGEIKNGEGVYGLQRAFQVAGAKSLIMSLWKVPDAPSQELMLSFYTKWLVGMDKREAFRQSQMELAKKYPNFYYWGAFEIITN